MLDIQGEPDLQCHVCIRLFVCPTLITSESFNRSINIATVIYPHHCGSCNFTACNEVSKWVRKAKVENKVFIILTALNDTVCCSHKLITHTEHARTHTQTIMWNFHPAKVTDQLAVAICVGINWVMSNFLLRRGHNRHLRLVLELHYESNITRNTNLLNYCVTFIVYIYYTCGCGPHVASRHMRVEYSCLKLT